MCAAYYYSGGGGVGIDGNSHVPINTIMNNNTTLVVDIGSYSSKIGWAGDDYPRGYFRSVRTTTKRFICWLDIRFDRNRCIDIYVYDVFIFKC